MAKRLLSKINGDEGYILEEPVYMGSSILCQAGKELDENTVTHLKRFLVHHNGSLENISVKIKVSKEVEELDFDIPSFLGEELENSTLEALKNTYRSSKQNIAATLTVVDSCIADITRLIESKPELSYSLGQYKEIPNNGSVSVFEHSIQVAQFAVALANIYNNSIDPCEVQLDLKTIGMAALLHDYGSCFNDEAEMKKLSLYRLGDTFLQNYPTIPADVLQQTYNDNYRTVYAYSSLKNYLPSTIATMILLSGESDNGAIGLGIENNKNDAVSMGARIIFLSNLYDSLLRNTISQNESLENVTTILQQLAINGVISEELTSLFIDNIPLYSVGVRVLLSNYEYATVVERFKGNDNYKPVVRTLVPAPLKPEIIDLRKTTNITILSVVGKSVRLSDKLKDITKAQLETIDVTSVPYDQFNYEETNKGHGTR